MRFWEALLIISNLAIILLYLAPVKRAYWTNFLPILALLVMLIQLMVEKYRWQMLPAYLVTVALVILMTINVARPISVTPLIKNILTVSGLSLLVISALLAIILPVSKIPYVSGPYAIGTSVYHWIDPNRLEIYGDSPGQPRELMAQIWYPAEPEPGAKALPWLPEIDIIGPAIGQKLGLPSFLLAHANRFQTDAFADAPLASTQPAWPVIIYSHGWGGFRKVNLDQLETLASNGYIVISLDHTYGSLATLFPDGRVAPSDPNALPDDAPDEIYWPAAQTLVDTYAGDVRFALDQLTSLNAGTLDPQFAQRLDLERIGLFGHSTGGGAIVEVCSTDPRCKAGLGQDAWVEPVTDDILARGLAQPFLFMRSDLWREGENEDRLMMLYNTMPNEAYLMGIVGAWHRDYTLLPLFSPLAPAFGLKGPINGQRVLEILDIYTLAFFNQYLKDEASPLLNGPSPEYPEVLFEKR